MDKISPDQSGGLKIHYLPVEQLNSAPYNPRKWGDKDLANLEKSLRKYGIIDPAIINNHPDRKNVVIGGHMRIHVAKKMGLKEMPCVFVTIGDIEKEKELNPTLNKVQGDWDWDLLKGFSESLLTDVGFESEEIDDIFGFENEPENFDLDRELKKLCI